jgi:hypothetical protein
MPYLSVFLRPGRKALWNRVEPERSFRQKEIPMKRIVAITLFLAASFLTARTAKAQSHAVEVNVPFSFTINDTALPAGKYTIASELSEPATLVIRDRTHAIKAIDMGLNDPTGLGKSSQLVFHHYGDLYFLSEIRFAPAYKAVFLPPTKLEKIAKKHSRKEGVTSIATS